MSRRFGRNAASWSPGGWNKLRDSFPVCRNHVETVIPYLDLNRLLVVDALVQPCAPPQQATDLMTVIVERFRDAAL